MMVDLYTVIALVSLSYIIAHTLGYYEGRKDKRRMIQ